MAKRKLTLKKKKDYIFVAILLAYPILQFVVTWAFVNIESVLFAFQHQGLRGTTWTFDNIAKVFTDIFSSSSFNYSNTISDEVMTLLNSLGYGFITIFITLPLSLVFSYFLQKGVPLSNTLRIIFFLPNIIPVVALTLAFNIPLKDYGYMNGLVQMLGIPGGDIYGSWPTSQLFIYVYCIWAGLGYNIVLMSGAIGRIPKELFESAQLDGAGYAVEFFKITIPLIWSTVVTLVVLGLTNVLTLYLQPYLLTNGTGKGGTTTIAMEIFMNANISTQYGYTAAKGLILSLVWAPVVLFVRNRMSKLYSDIDF